MEDPSRYPGIGPSTIQPQHKYPKNLLFNLISKKDIECRPIILNVKKLFVSN